MATTVRTKGKKLGGTGEATVTELGPAELFGSLEMPYAVTVTIAGVRTYFFSRPDMDQWEKDEDAPPGAKSKRGANIDYETLVWRCENGALGFPNTQLQNALMAAGRYSPDPSKTGRRSALPFIGESVTIGEEIVSFGVSEWDAIDVRIARYANGRFGPRRRPILHPGWRATFNLHVLVPELIRPGDVLVLANRAGMVRGIGDNVKYGAGRFTVESFSEPFELHW